MTILYTPGSLLFAVKANLTRLGDGQFSISGHTLRALVNDVELARRLAAQRISADTLRRWVSDFEVGVARMPNKQRTLAEVSVRQMRDALLAATTEETPR